MELLILIILYYLSQNPDFERSVKPLLGELKNSEHALKFLEELSQFSRLFSSLQSKEKNKGDQQSGEPKREEKQASPSSSQTESQQTPSPTAGIADGFIEELLSKYFQSGK